VPLRLVIFVSFTLTVEVKRTKRLVTQYHHIIEAASRVPRYPSRILNEPSFLYYVKQARETTIIPVREVVKGLSMGGVAPAVGGLSTGPAGATFATNLREILKSATPETMGPSSLQLI